MLTTTFRYEGAIERPSGLIVSTSARQAPPPAVANLPGVGMFFEGGVEESVSVTLPLNTFVVPPVRGWLGSLGMEGEEKARILWQAAEYGYSFHVIENELFQQLRSYQQEGVRALLQRGQFVLADDMGLGKTLTAIVAAQQVRSAYLGGYPPALIVAPKPLRREWRGELVKWGVLEGHDDDRWHALEGTKLDLSKIPNRVEWLFCHYDILAHWWSLIWSLRPIVAIFDEAHVLKNPRTKRFRGAQLAAGAVPFRWALTGTPILGKGGELHTLLDLIVGKYSYGTQGAFRKRYLGAHENRFGGLEDRYATNVEELKARARVHVMRRTRSQHLDLPPCTRTLRKVRLTKNQEKSYAKIFEGYSLDAIYEALRRHAAGKETIKRLGKARKITAKAKRKHTYEELMNFAEQGEDVLLFTWFREDAEYFLDRFYQSTTKAGGTIVGGVTYGPWGYVGCVHGGITQKRRDERIAAWQNTIRVRRTLEQRGETGMPALLVATYGCLGVGVNLQDARAVVFHDLDWTPATMLQAEARVHRGGQGRPVISRWVVAAGTVDEIVTRLVQEKGDLIQEMLDDTGAAELGEMFHTLDEHVKDLLGQWQAWRTAG